jgi:hypothetical protein
MGTFDVSQRIQDGYFDANKLLYQWNKSHDEKRRKMAEFMESSSTKQFVEVLENEVGRNSDMGHDVAITVKGRTHKNGQKDVDQVWMHPYLFIDFAMWINPKFKLDVIRFVYDQLIQFRHSAGDNYKGLTSAVTRFDKVNYPQLAKGLNYIVFDKHEENLRQVATIDQLNQLAELQKQLAFAVNMGYIRSFDELINEMRRIWNMKHNNFIS